MKVKHQTEIFRQEFPKRLISVMKERDMSQKQLAVTLGVKEGAVSKYVAGDRLPRVPTLVLMSRILDVDLEWLACVNE